MAQNRNWLRLQYHGRILSNRTQWYSLDLNEEDDLKLHVAARTGDEPSLGDLIKSGADVNVTDTRGATPLMCAVRWGQTACIEALIREGADVNICNNIDHCTALTQIAYSFPDSFEEDGFFDYVEINKEGNEKEKDNRKRTIEKIVYLLKEAGADVNSVNMKGYTALAAAITVGNMDCMQALLNAGADVNTNDINGNTTLIIAAGLGCSRRSQSIRLLLQAGARVNKRNKLGLNALEHYLTQHASVSKQIALLLYAAGEILENDTIETSMYGYVNIIRVVVPEFIELSKLKLSLKHNCRQTIRKHLTLLDPHKQLFGRVPKLGLPSSLTRYLLYGVSLDEDCASKYDKYDQVELQRRKFLP